MKIRISGGHPDRALEYLETDCGTDEMWTQLTAVIKQPDGDLHIPPDWGFPPHGRPSIEVRYMTHIERFNTTSSDGVQPRAF